MSKEALGWQMWRNLLKKKNTNIKCLGKPNIEKLI